MGMRDLSLASLLGGSSRSRVGCSLCGTREDDHDRFVYGGVLLRRGRDPRDWRAERNGLLPLSVVPLLVWRPGQCVLSLALRGRRGAQGSPPITFPSGPERWWGDKALEAEADSPQATLEQRHQAAGDVLALRRRGFFSAGALFSIASHMPVETAQ